MSNDTIQLKESQDKYILILAGDDAKKIWHLLSESGIPSGALAVSELGIAADYLYEPQVSKMAHLYDFSFHVVPGSFNNIKEDATQQYLSEKLIDMERIHGPLLREYQSLKDGARQKPDKARHVLCDTQELSCSFMENLKNTVGKKRLGLETVSLPELDEAFYGWRGLGLLFAASNVGKTALTIQLGIESLLVEKNDSCLLFVSLEMSPTVVYERMTRYFTEMSYRRLHFGDTNSSEKAHTQEERMAIKNAIEKMKDLSSCIGIISSEIEDLSATDVIEAARNLMNSSGKSRVFIVIDYLQVWPMQGDNKSDLEADKWRINELKKISHAFPADPVLAISEARKSQSTTASKVTPHDIMGSARNAYAPDFIISMNTLDKADTLKLLLNNGLYGKHTDDEDILLKIWEKALRFHERSLVHLKVEKCRDGMHRTRLLTQFLYQRNKFIPATCLEGGEIMQEVKDEYLSELRIKNASKDKKDKKKDV